MNYTELRTAVEDYCENSFTDTDFAIMTKLAEQKIINSVQMPATRKNVTGTLTTNNAYLSAPTDFLSVFSVEVMDLTTPYPSTFLLNKDVNFIREAYPPNVSATGLPKYYAIFGTTTGYPNELSFIVGPTPDKAYQVELHYYAYPESITTANTTWLGDNFDSVLFNAVMVEAIRFMKGEQDLVQLYSDQYKQALTLLKNLVDGKQRQDSYRSGQVRTQVI